MEIVPYEKKNTLVNKYNNGEVNSIALKYAKRFHEVCYTQFKNIQTENNLFNLFVKTFNPYSPHNKETQLKNIDEMIDAVNMFDEILIALASKKGLNICKVYLSLEKSLVEPQVYKPKKYLIWSY